MKTFLKALAVCIALPGMAQANEEVASLDRQDNAETLVVASICEAPQTQAVAASERFARAAALAREECLKPGWSWDD